jgi:MFS transporter, DHA1 family, inner membrane transport protein
MADSGSTAGSTPVQNEDWLVGNPSVAATAAALWIGSAGLLILGVIPILYGALNAESRINLTELGVTATVETLLIGVSSAVAAMLFSARHLRFKCTILLVVLAALDAAISLAGSSNLILIDRALAGLVEGAMVAVSIELIARSRHAERLGGFFLAMQALAQGLIALGLAWWVVPGMGANGGFLALGVVCLVSIGVALLVPSEYGEMPKQSASMDGVFTVRAILSLLMIGLFFMFVVAVWTFVEPLGGKVGIDAQTVGVLVSIGLFVQVAGSLAAAWLESYLDYRLGILGCGVVGLIAAAILGGSPTLLMFCVAVLAISFVWMFIVPFMIAMTLAADSTRSTCLLVPAAQLLGAAFGPLAATAFVEGENASAVPLFGIAMTVLSLALFGLFLIAVRRRSAA